MKQDQSNTTCDKNAATTIEDIKKAAEAIKGHAHRTQVVTSEYIDRQLTELAATHQNNGKMPRQNINVFIKCENFQKTGSFKFRGAFNAFCNLTPEQREKGVLAYSAGNHGQGIALSGKLMGVKTKIIVPKDTNQLKQSAMRGYGAELYHFDRYKENVDEVIKQQTEETGMTFIDPFNNQKVIAGQGTVALELLEQAGQLDHLIMGVGGGGLISGCAIAAKAINPNIQVHGVEPYARGDVAASLAQNKVIWTDPADLKQTIADGASTPHIGELNLPIMRRLVSTVTSAKNDELISIMKLYAERCKIVSEPTGCLGLVGIQHLVRKGVIKPGDRVGCLITGGNVDMLRYTQLITGPSADPVIEKTTQILEVNTQQTKTSDNASLQSNDQEDFSGSDEGSHPIFDELSSPVVNKFQVKDEIEEDKGRRSACHDFFSLRKILARFVSL